MATLTDNCEPKTSEAVGYFGTSLVAGSTGLLGGVAGRGDTQVGRVVVEAGGVAQASIVDLVGEASTVDVAREVTGEVGEVTVALTVDFIPGEVTGEVGEETGASTVHVVVEVAVAHVATGASTVTARIQESVVVGGATSAVGGVAG